MTSPAGDHVAKLLTVQCHSQPMAAQLTIKGLKHVGEARPKALVEKVRRGKAGCVRALVPNRWTAFLGPTRGAGPHSERGEQTQ